MSGIRIRVVDNTQYFLRGKNDATEEILEVIGQLAVEHAQEDYVPYLDIRGKGYSEGDLHDSIDYDRVEKAVRIFSTMPYAAYVEVGTKYQDAQPYLRPAMENHQGEYKDIAISIYRGEGNVSGRRYTYLDDD